MDSLIVHFVLQMHTQSNSSQPPLLQRGITLFLHNYSGINIQSILPNRKSSLKEPCNFHQTYPSLARLINDHITKCYGIRLLSLCIGIDFRFIILFFVRKIFLYYYPHYKSQNPYQSILLKMCYTRCLDFFWKSRYTTPSCLLVIIPTQRLYKLIWGVPIHLHKWISPLLNNCSDYISS